MGQMPLAMGIAAVRKIDSRSCLWILKISCNNLCVCAIKHESFPQEYILPWCCLLDLKHCIFCCSHAQCMPEVVLRSSHALQRGMPCCCIWRSVPTRLFVNGLTIVTFVVWSHVFKGSNSVEWIETMNQISVRAPFTQGIRVTRYHSSCWLLLLPEI